LQDDSRTGLICGVDEAGCGPLAGPVIAAAVIFDESIKIDGLADSKLLTPAARLKLVPKILKLSAGYAIAGVSNLVIDKLNILRASLLSMRKAVEKLPSKPELVLVDGNQMIPDLDLLQRTIVKGDTKIPQISAASILAKVARDIIMIRLAELYPEYKFENNKGYGTRHHLNAIKEFGPCQIHRRSFQPICQYNLID